MLLLSGNDWYKMNINLKDFIICESLYGNMIFPRNDMVVGRSLPLYGEWSEGENIVMSQFVNNGDSVIDIGANIGFYSILLSEYFKIIKSYEPNLRNFHVLNKNIKKNNLQKKVQTFNYGLSNKKQILKGTSMTKGELFQTSGFSLSERNEEGEDVFVNIGDEVLNFNGEILTIKIDVEGHELFVLQGMKKVLENNYCIIQIEIWDKNYQEINEFLNNLDYKKSKSIDGDTYFSNTDLN